METLVGELRAALESTKDYRVAPTQQGRTWASFAVQGPDGRVYTVIVESEEGRVMSR